MLKHAGQIEVMHAGEEEDFSGFIYSFVVFKTRIRVGGLSIRKQSAGVGFCTHRRRYQVQNRSPTRSWTGLAGRGCSPAPGPSSPASRTRTLPAAHLKRGKLDDEVGRGALEQGVVRTAGPDAIQTAGLEFGDLMRSFNDGTRDQKNPEEPAGSKYRR